MQVSGVNLWRQVSEAIAGDIEAGRFATDERLPTSAELAQRFQVNRHTVLKAISHLESQGLVRIERGRGAYAVVNPVEFRLGPQQWFEQNLLESNRTPSRTVLAVENIPASREIAEPLEIRPGAPVLYVRLLGAADGLPVTYGYNHFALERLPGLEAAFERIGVGVSTSFSFGELFRSAGVEEWRRKTIFIRARLPQREEAASLKLAPSHPLIVTTVISVDGRGAPIVVADTCYGGGRTTLRVDL